MSGIPAEIITLQLGNYSNFVGAHLFNLQDPIDKGSSDEFQPLVLWREKKIGSSSTYTPRVLIFDTKENSSTTSIPSPLENPPNKSLFSSKENQVKAEASLWDGKTEQINREEFMGLQNGKCWADMLRWKLTPDTEGFILPNYSHNSETGKLSSFSQGQEIWTIMEDSVIDGIRKYAEESDNLQGFQILVDEEEGFSGIAGGILQHLSDEYDKKVCFGIGVSPPNNLSETKPEKGKEFQARMVNRSLTWNAFYHYSTIFSSLGLSQDIFQPTSNIIDLPFLNYKGESVYESSSILAAALDTLISPHRCRNALVFLPEFASFLNVYGRKMTSISSSFPFPLDKSDRSLFALLQENGLESVRSLTPGVSIDFDKATGNYFVIRGVPVSSTISEKERMKLRGLQQDIKSPSSCLDVFSKDLFSRSVNVVQAVSTPLTVCNPFPSSIIDKSALNRFTVHKGYSQGIEDSWGFSALSCAHNTPQTGDLLEKLINEIGGRASNDSRVNCSFSSSDIGIEVDDFLQCINDLNTLREAYEISY